MKEENKKIKENNVKIDNEAGEKEKLKKKLKINTIIIIVLVVLLIISIIAVVVSVKTSGVNEENNLSNLGLATSGDGYVFYYKSQVGIIKVKDGEEYEISDDQAYSLSYYDGYLYYTTPNSTGGITIKKMSHNGDEVIVLKDTASSSLKMYLVDGYLYFLTSDPALCKMDLNGENEQVLIKRSISDFNISDETIYFVDDNELLCKIDINGENYSQLLTDSVCSKFQVYDGNMYFYEENKGLMKINLETLESELFSDQINSDVFNVTDKGIFYLDEENFEIYKISLNGKKVEEIAVVNTTNTWINVVDNELYYLQTDSDTNSTYKTYRVKIDGKEAEEIVY